MHKSVNKVELGLKFSFQVFFTLAEFEPYAFEIFGLWWLLGLWAEVD